MIMKIATGAAAIVAAGCFAAVSAAQAAALSIVEVGAPAVNCAFNNAGSPNCTVVVDDSVGTFTPPGDTGTARLQSRTYPGAPAAPWDDLELLGGLAALAFIIRRRSQGK